jgi:hypothetical protein
MKSIDGWSETRAHGANPGFRAPQPMSIKIAVNSRPRPRRVDRFFAELGFVADERLANENVGT